MAFLFGIPTLVLLPDNLNTQSKIFAHDYQQRYDQHLLG